MNKLNKDVLILISLKLNLSDLINLSKTCSNMYKVLENKNIWLNLLRNDFNFNINAGFYRINYPLPDLSCDNSNFYKTDFYGKSFKEIYSTIYRLIKFKIRSKYNINVETLYKSDKNSFL
jgi:F-box domain